MLLPRTAFREAVFERDQHKCVVCKVDPAVDAHHLIERRLWPDGGYYLDNGVSLCAHHHLLAEQTTIPVQALRDAAGIKTVLLPPGFDDESNYDKWGNPIWPDGTRARGPLFNDESVQKILKRGNVLDLFKPYYKHARTMHLPWSPNRGTDGDKVHSDDSSFIGKDVVVTLKMDGEQTTFYSDRYHARSIENTYHSSRTWVANLFGQIAHEIPEGYRLVGENLFARHSVAYEDLPSYFFLFAIFNDLNKCLSWRETQEWADLLGVQIVPTLYEGPYERSHIEALDLRPQWSEEVEGYVLRWAEKFDYTEWHEAVGKWVRKDHVKTDQHWRHKPIMPNSLTRK